MVGLLCSKKVSEKLELELNKSQIEIAGDSALILVERGYNLPEGKTCIVFDAIDYMEVVQLLLNGIRREHQLLQTVTGFSENKYAVMEPKDILYLEAGIEGLLSFTNTKAYSMKETLQYYEALWTEKGFFRVNKSQLVNLYHVKEIVPWFNSRYVLKMNNGHELEVSKIYAKKLRSLLKI